MKESFPQTQINIEDSEKSKSKEEGVISGWIRRGINRGALALGLLLATASVSEAQTLLGERFVSTKGVEIPEMRHETSPETGHQIESLEKRIYKLDSLVFVLAWKHGNLENSRGAHPERTMTYPKRAESDNESENTGQHEDIKITINESFPDPYNYAIKSNEYYYKYVGIVSGDHIISFLHSDKNHPAALDRVEYINFPDAISGYASVCAGPKVISGGLELTQNAYVPLEVDKKVKGSKNETVSVQPLPRNADVYGKGEYPIDDLNEVLDAMISAVQQHLDAEEDQ